MLIGAFFGAWGADVTGDAGSAASSSGSPPAASSACCTPSSRSRLRADQIVSGTAINFLALGITGFLYVKIYGDAGHARRPAADPRRAPADRLDPVRRRRARAAQPDDLARPDLRRAARRSSSSARRAGCACARSARTRSPPTRPASRRSACATTRSIASGAFAALGGVFLSIGFVHSFSQNMTRGQGLHRPRRGHLRQVEARRRARRGAAVRLLAARSRSGCRCSRRRPRRCSRRCPTCSR